MLDILKKLCAERTDVLRDLMVQFSIESSLFERFL